MEEPQQQQTACGHCGEAASKRCGNCRNMRYCSEECQLADKPYHKLLCSSFINFLHRPGENYRRAILLPADQDKPRFIWLQVRALPDKYGQCEGVTITGTEAGESQDLGVPDKDDEAQAFIPTKKNPLGRWEVDTMSRLMICGRFNRGELLDHSVLLMSPRDPTNHQPNKCMLRSAELVKANVKDGIDRGPLIFIGMNKVKLPKFTVDLDTNDLTLSLDAALGAYPPGQVAPRFQKAPGIKIGFNNPQTFESIEVPRRHPALTPGLQFHSKTAYQLEGHWWSTWLYPDQNKANAQPAASKDKTEARPLDARVLQACVDTASQDFGRVPPVALDNQRGMLVVLTPPLFNFPLEVATVKQAVESMQYHKLPILTDETLDKSPEERLRMVQSSVGHLADAVKVKLAAKKAERAGSAGAAGNASEKGGLAP